MVSRPPTRTSTLRLSEAARHVVVPAGVVSTGWPAVREKCGQLGISFRPWQEGGGRLILAKRADGKYASTIGGTGMSIPRQVGKTFLVAAIVFALCLLRPGLTVIWTAHRLRVAEETFGKMQVFAKRRTIAPYIRKIILGSGEEEIRFRNGSRILFGARERGFGRGFDEIDVLIFDEAQILGESALDDMVPATNQSRQREGALLLFLGTPPKPTDSGEVFKRMRTDALSGEDSDTAWVEFGADPGFNPTPLPAPLSKADWVQVAKANPSYPDDTPRESILRMRKKLGPDSFLREGLGIWDDDEPDDVFAGAWGGCATKRQPPKPAAVGVACDVDQVWLALGAASGGAKHHLGSVLRVRADTSRAKFVAEVKRIQTERKVRVAIDAHGPASFLIQELEAAGVKLTRASLDDYVQACADLRAKVATRQVDHGNYADLNNAVEAADWRKVGDRRVFARRNGDISSLEAVTLADWAAGLPTINAAWGSGTADVKRPTGNPWRSRERLNI